MKTDEEIRIGVDALQGDLALHQRRTGTQVTGESNRLLVAETYERLSHEWAEAKPTPCVPDAPAGPVDDTKTADVDGKKYTVDRSASDDIAFRKATESEAWFLAHALPRIELLMTKEDRGALGQPSYRERVLAVMSLHRLPDKRRYIMELVTLLEDSNRHFGDWKADSLRRSVSG